MMDLLLLSRNAAVFIVVIAMLRLVFKWFLPRTAFVVLWLAAAVRMRRNFNKVNDKILDVAQAGGDLTKVLDISSGDELEVIGDSLNLLLQKTGNMVFILI